MIRWSFVAAMILMVLFCGLLSSSPRLHEAIHPDANNQHHQCAITIFAHGQVDLTDGGQALATPSFGSFRPPFFSRVRFLLRAIISSARSRSSRSGLLIPA